MSQQAQETVVVPREITAAQADVIGMPQAMYARAVGFVAMSATANFSLAAPVSPDSDLLKEAVGLLRGFAREAENWADQVPDDYRSLCTEPGNDRPHPGSETEFTVGDLRAARAFLSKVEERG